MTTSSPGERQQVDMVIERLVASHSLPRESIEKAVETAYRQLDDSTIRDYVPLLVERRALRDLRQI